MDEEVRKLRVRKLRLDFNVIERLQKNGASQFTINEKLRKFERELRAYEREYERERKRDLAASVK